MDARAPEPDTARKVAACDAVCLALPREVAREWVAAIRLASNGRPPKIVDLSDAHRLEAPVFEDDPSTSEVHYGLPEVYGPPPAHVTVVANPGCYPTATILAVRPLLESGRSESR